MRTDWSRVRLWIALLAALPLSGVTLAEKPAPLRDTERVIVGRRVIVANPPDATEEAPAPTLIFGTTTDATGGVAATSDCDAIGGWSLVPPLTGSNRFRGNHYTVDHSVKLIEYASELAITNGAVANLEFVVYEYDDFNLEWTQIHEKTTSVTGNGQRAFYSTGLLEPPVQLSANHKYVIGVAWTNTTITYNTDSENYPRNFAVGSVDGRVALNNPASPMPDTVGIFTINPAGVYSMQLCFTGACCLPNDQCADVTETECLLQQGQFSASGVGCLGIGACPMPRGACCQPSGSCSYINEYKCGTLAGAWTEGVRCENPSEPCAPRGGCCLSDGTCIPDRTVTQCTYEDGGSYRGDDVTCADFPPCTAGACCDRITDECTLEVTETDCVESGGSFAGPGTRCVDQPCSVKGACCTGTTCQSVTAAACDGLSGTYRGDLTTCDALDVACGRGACCVPGVGCRVLTEAGCTTFGGAFRGEGLTCDNISPGCPGVCCAFGSVCSTNATPELCVESEGVFLGYGGDCGDPNNPDNPRPDPCTTYSQSNVAACCLGNTGDCVDYLNDDGTHKACNDLGGTHQSDTTCALASPPCPVYEPTGACCQRGILACSDNLTEAECTVLGPNAQWTQGVLCSNLYPICEPLGACCNRNALTCVDSRTESECPDEWNVDQTCNEVACAPTGACCDPVDHSCSDLTAYNCEQAGDTFSGEGTSCADAGACLSGACCHRDGTCDDGLLEEECIADGGEPDPDFHVGRLCNDVCFPRGACCSGSDCVIATRAACGNDLNYRGDGSDCEPDLCTVGACCSPDGSFCADQTKLICDQSGWTYHPGEACVGQACPQPMGACCTTEGGSPVCAEMTQSECVNSLGYYSGDGSACGDLSICDAGYGACCDPSGASPCQMLTAAECDNVSGYFAGAGTSSCSDDGVCGLGACCDATETTCTTTNQANCEPDGIFRGVGTPCLDGQCPPPPGACCIINPAPAEPACVVMSGADCLANGNFYAGDATACDTSGICTLGGCCQRDGTCADNVNAASCVPDPSGAPPVDFRAGRECSSFCAPRGACCHEDVCTIEGRLQCEDGLGTYSGDGTDCAADTCLNGACCELDPDTQAAMCEETTRQQCEDLPDVPGIYSGAGTDCSGGPNQCNRGVCCPPEGQPGCFDDTVAARCANPAAFTDGGDFLEGLTCGDCVGRGACCLPSGACEVRTAFACTSGGGNYSGDNTDCSNPGMCVNAGCCLPDGSCQIETLQECTFLGGAYLGIVSDCSQPCLGACCDTVTGECTDVAVGDCTGTWTANTSCAELDPACTATLGACCTMDGCDDTKELDCAGTWTADTTCAELNPPCPKYGACCTDTTCSIDTEADCLAGGGTYGGDDTACEADLCEVGACCLPDDSCQDVTLLACNGITDGAYQGPGTACNAGQCPFGCEQGIEASSPENCAIDARYPTNPNDAGIVFGWDSFNLTVACDASALTAGDFSIRVEPNDVAVPVITNVSGSGLSVTITLDGPIPAGHWTCVKHLTSGTEACLGFLPGDVDASRATTASDILQVLDYLNGNLTLETYQCDVDRSGACNATDVLGVIDLLNGSGAFDIWNNVTLPVCPTAP